MKTNHLSAGYEMHTGSLTESKLNNITGNGTDRGLTDHYIVTDESFSVASIFHWALFEINTTGPVFMEVQRQALAMLGKFGTFLTMKLAVPI